MRVRLSHLRSIVLANVLVALVVATTIADETIWTGTVGDNFFGDGNWDTGAPNTATDIAVIDGGSNLPAVVDAATATIEIGGIHLGKEFGGGHVIQNGGTISIAAGVSDTESVIGDFGTDGSSWIMNNDAALLYDDPLGGDGNGLGDDGTGKDFDVGKNVGPANPGTLELHDSAVLRISDDLKIADGDNGNGVVLLDGNAQMSVGSGISFSSPGGTATLTLAGSAQLVSGNSGGAGNTAEGRTDEGYLTLSTDESATAVLEVRDSASLYIRTLQQRNGISSITVRDNGQFHVFDAFHHAAPDLGAATVTGSVQDEQRTSHVSSTSTAETTISLTGNAVMTIDSDLDDSAWSGFALSGGTNQGANSEGGITLLEISDSASFTVEQDLHMTLGTGDFAESTLSVRGPDATAAINGDLRMALDESGFENLGTATLRAVITGAGHTTMKVGGDANIGNGHLTVELDGYAPVGGESYALITAGSVTGSEFRSEELPELTGNLSWDLVVGANIVELNVMGLGLLAGDADMDLDFDQFDLIQVQVAAKYLVAVDATWGEGDWNGAPGGAPGAPPPGDNRFNQLDIIAALGPGHYLTGPYAAINPGGESGDGQTSIIYNASTGEVGVDAPAGTELTSININSAASIFTGDAARHLGGSFDNDGDNNVFKATFGSSFGSLSFGNVAQTGLSEDFVANNLTVVGSLAGGGDLGDVDLIYVPEPSAILLLTLGVVSVLASRRRR